MFPMFHVGCSMGMFKVIATLGTLVLVHGALSHWVSMKLRICGHSKLPSLGVEMWHKKRHKSKGHKRIRRDRKPPKTGSKVRVSCRIEALWRAKLWSVVGVIGHAKVDLSLSSTHASILIMDKVLGMRMLPTMTTGM